MISFERYNKHLINYTGDPTFVSTEYIHVNLRGSTVLNISGCPCSLSKLIHD